MKQLLILMVLGIIYSTILTSCFETPRNRRVSVDDGGITEVSTTIIYDTPTDDNSSSDPDSSMNLPPEMSNCRFSSDGVNGFYQYGNHIGAFNICRTEETKVYFQLQIPVTNARVCLIPTTTFNQDGVSTSVYIGEPRCLYIQNNTQYYPVTFVKNRPNDSYYNYSSFPIDGVMIIKDESHYFSSPYVQNQEILATDAYLYCMQRLVPTVWYGQVYPADPNYCNVFNSAGNFYYHKFE